MDPLAGIGDRCSSCRTTLASDQRYCINCGQRRGKPRFSLAALALEPAPAAAAAPLPARAPQRSRVGASVSFIAGVATLLLAMGVGVLIGHSGNDGKVQQAAAPAQVIKIEGGTGPSQASSVRSTTSARRTAGARFKAPKLQLSGNAVQAVNNAASNVLGSGSAKLAPATVQQGQTCAHGAGCEGGHFTGNFFGQ
jgi:hypothetical protein